jgi:hypothetical protein
MNGSNSSSENNVKNLNKMDNIGYQSKRRKTTNCKDNEILINPLKIFDLNQKTENLLGEELNNKNTELDYVLNSHKKRTFNKIDNESKPFISRIPRPARVVNIVFSKYSELESRIPKYSY